MNTFEFFIHHSVEKNGKPTHNLTIYVKADTLQAAMDKFLNIKLHSLVGVDEGIEMIFVIESVKWVADRGIIIE